MKADPGESSFGSSLIQYRLARMSTRSPAVLRAPVPVGTLTERNYTVRNGRQSHKDENRVH
jgi:hypothetical protein